MAVYYGYEQTHRESDVHSSQTYTQLADGLARLPPREQLHACAVCV